MREFDVSNPKNRLDVQADKKQFSLIGYHLEESIQDEQVFSCILRPGHAIQLKSLLDTWLFRENGGRLGHIIWELQQFTESLAGEKESKGALRVAQIITEGIERAEEESIPPGDIALELAFLLSGFLKLWEASRKNTASMQ